MKFLKKHGHLIESIIFAGLAHLNYLDSQYVLASLAVLASFMSIVIYYLNNKND